MPAANTEEANTAERVVTPRGKTPAVRRAISMIVTAMNEEDNLRPTVESVLTALGPHDDYEILIINDGSRDRTGAIADELAAANRRIRVYHQPANVGLHRSYLKGIELASKDLIGWVAGNNIIPADALQAIFARLDDAEMVLSYPSFDPRRRRRRWVSRSFVILLNTLFGLRLRYYTGPCVYPARAAKQLRTISSGSMMVPELLIRLIKSNLSYVEVPITAKPRTAGKTKTFRPSNILYVASSVLHLVVDIRLRPQPRPAVAARAVESVEP